MNWQAALRLERLEEDFRQVGYDPEKMNPEKLDQLHALLDEEMEERDERIFQGNNPA